MRSRRTHHSNFQQIIPNSQIYKFYTNRSNINHFREKQGSTWRMKVDPRFFPFPTSTSQLLNEDSFTPNRQERVIKRMGENGQDPNKILNSPSSLKIILPWRRVTNPTIKSSSVLALPVRTMHSCGQTLHSWFHLQNFTEVWVFGWLAS